MSPGLLWLSAGASSVAIIAIWLVARSAARRREQDTDTRTDERRAA